MLCCSLGPSRLDTRSVNLWTREALSFGNLAEIASSVQMVFPSPGYSIAGLAVLLDELNCKTILTPSTSPEIVPAFLALHPLKLVVVQEIEELLAKAYLPFAFEKSFESSCHEPLVVLHTSGSTSHPKLVVWTHDFAASLIQQNQLEPPPGKQSFNSLCEGIRLIPMLPVFHVSRHSVANCVAVLHLKPSTNHK